MIIECLLKRLGGSHVELGDKVYHFAPNDKEHHVCAVEQEDHISTLLAIPEGYRQYGAKAEPTINLSKLQAGSADPIDNGGQAAATTTTSSQPGATTEQLTDEQELERLRAMYLERFGKKAHHAMGIKRLREELGLDEE